MQLLARLCSPWALRFDEMIDIAVVKEAICRCAVAYDLDWIIGVRPQECKN